MVASVVSGRSRRWRQNRTCASAWSAFMCSMIPRGRAGERIGFRVGVPGSVDPAHPPVATHVADALHVEAVEGEVAEVDVVRRRGVGLEVPVARGGAVVVGHGRQQTHQRDPPARERVGAVGHRLGHEQARPRVADRVLGVLGHEADEEERVAAIVEAVAGDRAVRIALRDRRPAWRARPGSPTRRGCDNARRATARAAEARPAVTRRGAALVAGGDLVPGRSFGHRAKLRRGRGSPPAGFHHVAPTSS